MERLKYKGIKKEGSDLEFSFPPAFPLILPIYLLLFKPDFTTNLRNLVTDMSREEFFKRMTSDILQVDFASIRGSGRDNNSSSSRVHSAP